MPSANDVYITPASRKIEWYGSSAMKGQIHHDDTNFYVSGTLDLKLQGADDISLMGYSGGSIITFGTDQTERMRLTSDGKLDSVHSVSGTEYKEGTIVARTMNPDQPDSKGLGNTERSKHNKVIS